GCAGPSATVTSGHPPLDAAPPARDPVDRRLATVRSILDAGHYETADSAAQALQLDLESQSPIDSLPFAAALDLVSEAAWRNDDIRSGRTVDAAKRSLAVRQSARGADSLDVAASLYALA